MAKRIIKFRVWDTIDKKFLYNGTDFVIYDGTSRENKYGDMIGMPHWGELEQFTGLHDKNGKEIYEGDIFNYYGTTFKIYWCEKSLMFRVVGIIGEDKNYDDDLATFEDDIEIIGNIHESL